MLRPPLAPRANETRRKAGRRERRTRSDWSTAPPLALDAAGRVLEPQDLPASPAVLVARLAALATNAKRRVRQNTDTRRSAPSQLKPSSRSEHDRIHHRDDTAFRLREAQAVEG